MNKRVWFLAVGLCLQSLTLHASAQNYPNKVVRIVVGFAPGGGTDVTSRLVAQKLSSYFGQSVVVENRPGASGSIGAEYVARAPADGYTLLMVASTTFINAVVHGVALERDFVPISLVTSAPLVLVVHPLVPAHDVKALIALARVRPGKLTYGSDGIGGTSHLAGELFNLMANVKLVHVPFKGGSESAVALAAGQIDINFPSLPAAVPLLGARKFRALAVTEAKRSAFLPAVPTLDESGLRGYDFGTWYGLMAPAAVPKNILAQIHTGLVKVVNTPEMKEAINKQGMEPKTDSPEQFAAFMHGLASQIVKAAKASGFKAE